MIQTKLWSLEKTHLLRSKLFSYCCILPSHQNQPRNQFLLLTQSWQKYIDIAHFLWHQSCNYSSKSHRKVSLNLLDVEESWLTWTKYPVFWESCEHPTGKRALRHHLLVSWGKILIPKQFIHIYTYSEIFQLIHLGETYKRQTSTWSEVKIIQEGYLVAGIPTSILGFNETLQTSNGKASEATANTGVSPSESQGDQQ